MRVPSTLLVKFKKLAKAKNTTVTQMVIDFMMAGVEKANGKRPTVSR